MRHVDHRLLVAALVAATAMLTIPVGTHAAQLTVQINNGDDDYKESQSGSSVRTDTTLDLWTTNDLKIALRFASVSIPQHATITQAILKVYSPATGISNNMVGTASGELVANAPVWTGATNEITNAPKTIASVDIFGLPTWTANTHNQIADVTSIVQEIVNQCTWEFGNALKIFLLATATSTHRRTLTYDSDPTRGAKLIIDYADSTTCNGRTIELSTRDGTLTSIDLGWVGLGHNGTSFARKATLSATLGSCEHTSPPCGTCQLTGPIANACANKAQISNHRCSNNTRTTCNTNADCGAGNTCDWYFGSYVPIKAANFCVANKVAGTMTGAVDLGSGDTAVDVPLTTSFTTSIDLCPTCNGDAQANDGVRAGTCNGGPNNGLSCDVSGGASPYLGDTSLDCPPAAGAPTSNTFSAETSVLTRTLSVNSPNCSDAPGKKCMCSTCNNATAQPCFLHSDCPDNPSGTAGVCGGKRCIAGPNVGVPCTVNSQCPSSSCSVPGLGSKPNGCADDTSTPAVEGACELIDGEYGCAVGPNTSNCSTATHVGCLNNGQCSAFHTCSNDSLRLCGTTADCVSPGTCITDTCVHKPFPCFEANGVVGQSVSANGSTETPAHDEWNAVLANQLTCVAHTNTSVDFAGLPGLSRLELPVHIRVRP